MSSYLKELCDFYKRMAADPDMPPAGFTVEKISFVLEISEEGELVRDIDIRDSKVTARDMHVPAAVTRSSDKSNANFLWDKSEYVLCLGKRGEEEKTARNFNAFKKKHERLLAGLESRHAKAFLSFIRSWKPEDSSSLLDNRAEIPGRNIVFKLANEDRYLHEIPELRKIALSLHEDAAEKDEGLCLVTGVTGHIARKHPKIKLDGAQGAGASLVSFNANSFNSYGKSQGANAPVSESAAHDYAAALNYLLKPEHKQCVLLEDTSFLFWTDQPKLNKEMGTCCFDLTLPKDVSPQDRAQIERLRSIFQAMRRGLSLNEADKEIDSGASFYVLGLAPNDGRAIVRYWLPGTLEKFFINMNRWYEELNITHKTSSLDFPSLKRLIKALAVKKRPEPKKQDKKKVKPLIENGIQKKEEIKVPQQLASQLIRSILAGTLFPKNMLTNLIQRVRSDKWIGYYRAALIKAYLCRNYGMDGESMRELNENEMNIGYRLGRVFAILERTQRDSQEKNEATEKKSPLEKTRHDAQEKKPATEDKPPSLSERYLGSASATPRMVFPLLLRLVQHHLAKAVKNKGLGYRINFNKQLGDIMKDMTDFPATLSLADQGRFMLGYYHQMNNPYWKSVDSTETATDEEETDDSSE